MDAVMSNIPLVCTLVGAVGVVFSIILAGIVKAHRPETRKCRPSPAPSRKAPLPT
jgi:hypothetical protein